MGRLAVILGSSATGPGGEAVMAAVMRHDAEVLQRHGDTGGDYVLPHLIDHVANLSPPARAGCDRVLSICSVGSLDAGVGVGSFVCPHDFIALQGGAVSVFDDPRGHATAGFDPGWRGEVLAAWGASGAGEASGAGPLRDGGVYWQTVGPRFETPAEIRLLAAHADLVGMTLASECIVAGELGMRCAALCVVDNLANGIGTEPLSPAEVDRHRERNTARLAGALNAVLPSLAE